jgi:SAM-dependent methyltransferase
MQKIESCPICSNDNFTSKGNYQDWHYNNKGEYSYSLCQSCNLVFQNPLYDDSELANFYPKEDYYAYKNNYHQVHTENQSKLNKRILDIGCGNGWVLAEYRQKGWDVAGVEPSKFAAESGNQTGLNIFNGTLLEASFQENYFDLVTSNHSFEHIYNPNEILIEVKKILKTNGELKIGVPNYNSFNSKLFGKHWYYFGAPVHTYNYSGKNLKLLIEKHGFEFIQINHVSGVLGILGSLQIIYNKLINRKNSSEGKIINSKFLFYVARVFINVQNKLNIGDCVEIVVRKK